MSSALALRRMHRWAGSLLGVFFVAIAVSGLGLQLEILSDDGSAPALGVAPKYARDGNGKVRPIPVSNEQIHEWIASSLRAAHEITPGMPVIGVQLRLVGDDPIGEVVVASPGPRQLFINARTGTVAEKPTFIRRVHFILLRLHRGEMIGPAGTAISIVCGLALLVLAATGLWMYLDMFGRRLRAGKRGLFW
jgi:uncharacterized iron-regulated membrane protein